MSNDSTTLTIYVGSKAPAWLDFRNEDGEPENFSDVDKAQVIVRESLEEGSVLVFSRSVDAGDLTVDATNSRLVMDAPGATTTPGTYIGVAWLHFATADDWWASQPFIVTIKASGIDNVSHAAGLLSAASSVPASTVVTT